MVKAREVNKDIKSIAAKVKTAVFSYDDIHNPDVKNEFHYDYEKVISEVARVNNWDKDKAKKYLLNINLLTPLPNGEYKVEVGTSTKGGGGLNYHGIAFFTLDNKDYQVKYHELAHSLQKEYHFFDDEKIDKMYRTSAKGIDEEKADELQINRVEYKKYLNEMHSESFSYAAMMLRAENPLDFAKQLYKAYNDARFRNITGFFSFGKTEYGGDNNNSKFYATFPVMKETIKTVLKIRKQGKTKEFFDENGVLKDEKLAKLCEQAVMKSAYSPRTLNAYFKYRIFDGHNDAEHGWRRDTIKSVAATIHGSVTWLAFEGDLISQIKSINRHSKLEKEEKNKINALVAKDQVFKDDETQALYDYIQIATRCAQVANKYKKGQYLDTGTLLAQSLAVLRYENNTVHEPSVRDQARLLTDNLSRKKQKQFADEFIALKYFVRDRKDNPYFCHLVQENVSLATVVEMYNAKLKNPEQKQILSPTPIKTYPKKENDRYAINGVRRCMFPIRDLADKYKTSKFFELKLVDLSLQGCEQIDNPETRKALADNVHFKWDVFGIKKRNFKKDLEETLDSISQEIYGQRNNLSYEPYKEQYKGKGVTVDEILDKTKADIQEYNKNNKKESAVKEDNTLQETDTQQNEDREKAVHMVNNNLEAMNYLAERYGISDNLRVQMQKMAVLSEDKLAVKELRKSLCNVVHFKGDLLGKEKHNFKKDLNKLMDSLVEDAKYQKDNPAYKKVCSEAMVQLNTSKTVNLSVETNENPEIQQPIDAKEIPSKEPVEQEKTPKDKVIDKLRSWGIEDNTYMLLTKEDNAYRSYGNGEPKSLNSYFEEGQKDIKETGKDVVYGTNNGLIGAYFAEGVYLVSANDKLRNALYYKGENNGFGVLLSNSEKFLKADGTPNKDLNDRWNTYKINANVANALEEIKEKKRAEQKKPEVKSEPVVKKSEAEIIYDELSKISTFADKHDVTGTLKESLTDTYMKHPEKLAKIEFWGDIAKHYAEKSSAGKELFTKDLGALGLDLIKDVSVNADNEKYQAIKKGCAHIVGSQAVINRVKNEMNAKTVDLSIAASR